MYFISEFYFKKCNISIPITHPCSSFSATILTSNLNQIYVFLIFIGNHNIYICIYKERSSLIIRFSSWNPARVGGRTLLQFGINKKDGRLELIILVFTGRSTPPSLLRFLPGWLTCFPLNRLEARLSLSFHFCFHFSASRVPRHCLPTTPLTTSTRFSNIRISRTCIKLHEKFSFSFFLSPSSLFHFSLFLETRFKFELIQGCIRISVKGRV